MPDLNFEIEGAEAVPYSASPLLNFRLLITDAQPAARIESVILRCQIQLEVAKRQYADKEKARLFDLFGEPERWGQTLKTMLWTHTNISVPSFSEKIVVDLPVPCTYDFNIAATKYFDGLESGDVPLCLLFSGTIFYKTDDDRLQVEQISWEKEAYFKLPISVWREMMEHYYPNSNWLNLRRDIFERLQNYKSQNFIPTWEKTFEKLLSNAENIKDKTEVTDKEFQM